MAKDTKSKGQGDGPVPQHKALAMGKPIPNATKQKPSTGK